MPRFSLSHLADHVLLRDLAALVARDSVTTAEMLAHLAEVDARKLYLPAAYASLYTYCVGELRMSGDAASKRIQAARVAREFPAVFAAVADGRLHLSAVVLLAPYLRPETADELLAAASHKTKAEIDALLVERFPKPDVPTRVEPVALLTDTGEHAPGHVASVPDLLGPPAGVDAVEHAPRHVEDPGGARVTPLSPGRFALQITISREMHDDLRYAQALLSHAIPAGDPAHVLARALKALIHEVEKRRFAPGARSRPGRGHRSSHTRRIPAEVRCAVWLRDGGQCAFVSDKGRRCAERKRLQFDHVTPVAFGGRATIEGIRLCCQAHNQYAAEQAFGAGFIQAKREQARRRAVEARTRNAAKAQSPRAPGRVQEEVTSESDPDRDVTPWLRALGCRADEARRGAQLCEEHIPEATMEEKVKFATARLSHGLARKISFAAPGPA